MTVDVLRRWWRRAAPSRAHALGALALAVLGALASMVLLGGSGLLVAKAAGGGGLAALGGLLVLIELVAFLRAPLRLRERLSAHRVALASMVTWRTWLYDTLAERAPTGIAFLARGDLLDRTIEDVDALQDLPVRIALPLLTTIVTGLVAAGAIGAFVPLGGAALLVALLAAGGVAIALGERAARSERAGVEARAEVSTRSVDLILGVGDLLMAGAVEAAIDLLDAAEARRRTVARRRDDLRGIGTTLIGLLAGGTVVATTLLAAAAHRAGHLTTGEVAALALIAVAGTEPLLGLLAAALRAPEVATSATRLDELAAIPIPVQDPANGAIVGATPLHIELRDVVAAARPGGTPVLDGVALDLPPGSAVAILGSSGAGKTTLCRVLLRFSAIEDGQMLLNGTDAAAVTGDEVRRRVAMLDQSPSLFGGTVRDCLRLGDPRATDEDLLDVLRRCELSELAGSSDELDLAIAEDGATLSGGQQRRLALARTMLRRPEVLVLDEPTAGLDDEQAASVLASCRVAAAGATIVLVTHEVRLTEGFDQVLWLEDGRLTPVTDEQLHILR